MTASKTLGNWPIFENEKRVLQYLADVYSVRYKIDGVWLLLWDSSNTDLFKVNLTDKSRFGFYTLWHRNRQNNLQGKKDYHKQLTAVDLRFVMFIAGTHLFNKSLNLNYQKEDFRAFVQDADKYYK